MAPTLIFKRRRGSGRIEPGGEVERPLSSTSGGGGVGVVNVCAELSSAFSKFPSIRLPFPPRIPLAFLHSSLVFGSPCPYKVSCCCHVLECYCNSPNSLIFTKPWHCAALINFANTPVEKKIDHNFYYYCFLSRTPIKMSNKLYTQKKLNRSTANERFIPLV